MAIKKKEGGGAGRRKGGGEWKDEEEEGDNITSVNENAEKLEHLYTSYGI